MDPIAQIAPDERPGAAPARVLVAINRRARHGNSDLDDAIGVLEAHFGAIEKIDLTGPEALQSALADAGRVAALEFVVIGGGDGTVSSAVPAVLEAGKPLAVLPLGTANDFARTLGLPEAPKAAAEVITRGRTRRIDLGLVNGRPFLNAAGIGFNVGLQRDLAPWLKRSLGPLAYPVGVILRWRRHRPFTVSFRGRAGMADTPAPHSLRAIQVTVANGRHYGGGMTAEQDARIDDGLLDVVIVLPRPWWRHVASAIRLRRGVYSEKAAVRAERWAGFELLTRRPMRIATDGEPTATTPATFGVLRQKLEVVVP